MSNRITAVAPAPTRIRVLIIEDSQADADLIAHALVRAGIDAQCERVDSAGDLSARLSSEPDLIVSDYALPQFNGIEALHMVRERGLDTPFILVSGSIGEDIAVHAIRHGADDYLLKDRLARLGPAALQAIENRRLRRDKERAESARRESELKFRELVEQAADGIFVTDTQGRILLANSRFCEMTGYGADEVRGLNVAET
jgi:CheY-like chemotaxis protein